MSMEIGFAAGFVAYQTTRIDKPHPESVVPQATVPESELPVPSEANASVSTSVMMGFVSAAYLTIEQYLGGGSASPGAEGASLSEESSFGANLNSFLKPMIFSPVFLKLGLPSFFGQGMPVSSGGQATQPSPITADTQPEPLSAPPLPVAGPVGPVVEPTVPELPVEELPLVEMPVSAAPVEPPVDEAPSDDDESRTRLPITEVSAEDFRRFRLKSMSSQLETSLTLELITRDGDRVTLDFGQLDFIESMKFRGRTHDGDRIRINGYFESTERMVNMTITGDLSDEEKEAINDVLSAVIKAADKFFDGSMDKAMKELMSMDFDTEELAEFSLQMDMTRSVELTRAFQGGRGIHLAELAQRNSGIMDVLEHFAGEQRKLINLVSEVMHTESAVRLVKSLLPPMLEGVLEVLADAVENHGGSEGAGAMLETGGDSVGDDAPADASEDVSENVAEDAGDADNGDEDGAHHHHHE